MHDDSGTRRPELECSLSKSQCKTQVVKELGKGVCAGREGESVASATDVSQKMLSLKFCVNTGRDAVGQMPEQFVTSERKRKKQESRNFTVRKYSLPPQN